MCQRLFLEVHSHIFPFVILSVLVVGVGGQADVFTIRGHLEQRRAAGTKFTGSQTFLDNTGEWPNITSVDLCFKLASCRKRVTHQCVVATSWWRVQVKALSLQSPLEGVARTKSNYDNKTANNNNNLFV